MDGSESYDGPVLLYHEKQVAALCGQHALNALLQGPYFTEIDLAQIAQELDALEQSFMAENGVDTESYRQWQSEGSGNVAADGMFSIQVLSNALEHWELSCVNFDSPEEAGSREHPEDEQAFICNLQEHWLTIRKIDGSWYNFNSLYPAPEFLGAFYLTAFLATLREQGYSIFVVKGRLPNEHPDAGRLDTPGKWFSPEEARASTKGAVNAREQGYLQAALSNCIDKASEGGSLVSLKRKSSTDAWGSGWGQSGQGSAEDDELARAIAVSIGGDAGVSTSSAPAGDLLNEDPELAAALAASLAESLSTSQSCAQAQENEADLASARLAALDPGQEPEKGPGMIDLALRLPDGERTMRRFRASARIHDVMNFLRWKGADVQGCHLTRQFPRKVFSDPQESLQAAGIENMETLTLQKQM